MKPSRSWEKRVLLHLESVSLIIDAQEDIIDGQTKLIESLLENFREVMTEEQRQKASALFYRVEETSDVIAGLRKQFKRFKP